MNLTYERIQELHQPGPSSQNVLKDLHDYIYQWTETIPTGGTRVDISEALKTIYAKHTEHLEAEKTRAAQTAAVESIDSYLDDDDINYDDDEYDSEDDADWDY